VVDRSVPLLGSDASTVLMPSIGKPGLIPPAYDLFSSVFSITHFQSSSVIGSEKMTAKAGHPQLLMVFRKIGIVC
jgi:hypothetical protein